MYSPAYSMYSLYVFARLDIELGFVSRVHTLATIRLLPYCLSPQLASCDY